MERCHFPVVRVRVPLFLALAICFSCSSWPFASAAYQSLPKQSLLVAIVVFKRCWPFSLVFPAKNCGHGFGSAHCSSGKWGALLLSPFSDAKDFAFCSAFLGKEARRVRHAFLVISGPHFAPLFAAEIWSSQTRARKCRDFSLPSTVPFCSVHTHISSSLEAANVAASWVGFRTRFSQGFFFSCHSSLSPAASSSRAV